MKLDTRSLSFLICDVLNVEHGSPEFYIVFECVIMHVCTGTKIKQFHRELGEAVNFKELELTPAAFRLMLADSGYITANLKFYTSYLSMRKQLCPLFAEEIHYSYQICKCDYETIYELVDRLKYIRKEIKAYIIKSGNKIADYTPDNFNVIRMRFNTMLPDLEKHARHVINKKLNFIRKSFNMTRDEFMSELIIHALRAYYKSAPKHSSELHQLNYLRTSISNKALNMIDSYVSQKRQRLVNMGSDNGDNAKFVLTTMAESQLPSNSEGETQSIDSLMDADHYISGNEKQDFAMSVHRLLDKYANRKRGFILAVFCGREINCFSDWLRKKRILRAADKTSQDILSARNQAEAMELVSEFVGLSATKIEQTLWELAHELGLSSRPNCR